jgi:MarR family transcriptional regulator, 2-MHQ and catechol-resistance regulon repressor
MPSHYKGTARELRALDAYLKMIRATGTLVSRLQPPVAEHGLTLAQLAVLDSLFHLGPLNQRTIARKIMRSNANVTAVLDNLEKQGLVSRKTSSEDRRVTTVSLTKAGKQRFQKVFPSHVSNVTEALGNLSPNEQAQLANLCKKLGQPEAE